MTLSATKDIVCFLAKCPRILDLAYNDVPPDLSETAYQRQTSSIRGHFRCKGRWGIGYNAQRGARFYVA